MNTSGQYAFTDKDVLCSDEDFALFESFTFAQPNSEEARESVQELDGEVQDLLDAEEYGDEHRLAILILLQPRNYFARLANLEQVGLPNGFNRGLAPETPPVNPLAGKHVAIYWSHMISKTLVHVLENVPLAGDARMKAYTTISDLLSAIQDNQVAGVLALHPRKGSVIDSLRHDFKNLPSQNQQSAYDFVFPPCIDVSYSTPLPNMALKIRQLSKGERVEALEFDLQASLPHLMVHAFVPQKPVNILVVDDSKVYLENMRTVLRSWPKVTVEIIVHEGGLPPVPTRADIVLLDEALSGDITGKQIHDYWSKNGFAGMVVSTTGGQKPSHVEYHFGQKDSMSSKHESAMEFVQFMNRLLSSR